VAGPVSDASSAPQSGVADRRPNEPWKITVRGDDGIDMHSRGSVTAYDRCQITVYGDCEVTAYDDCQITVLPNGPVEPPDRTQSLPRRAAMPAPHLEGPRGQPRSPDIEA
jgi:hypothetical protein